MIARRTITGRVLEASDEGPRGGEPLVLLHGFTGSKATWSALRRRLSPSRRVVAIDLPGHGGSDHESGGFDDVVRALDALLDVLEIGPCSLLGYSLGGRLALALALSRPERVARLLLESASPGLADAAERAARRREDEALAARIEREGVAAFVDHWERLPLFASLRSLPPVERDELRRQRLACSAAGLAASLRSVGAGSQPWLGDRLGELAMPVVLVTGADDTKYRAIAERMAARIARARVEVVAGAGHVPHLECRSAFEAIVDGFLAAPARRLRRERIHQGEAP